VIGEFEEPKLSIATDDWRGGGMPGAIKVDKGLEALEATATMGGHTAELIRSFGTTDVAGLPCAWSAPIRPTTAAPPSRSRSTWAVASPRSTWASPRRATIPSTSTRWLAYRRVVDGVEEVEIDMLSGLFRVGGVDRYAEIMAILTG
jgi:P2 family phage contractile tail tube protein